jgi:hypothetical protein
MERTSAPVTASLAVSCRAVTKEFVSGQRRSSALTRCSEISLKAMNTVIIIVPVLSLSSPPPHIEALLRKPEPNIISVQEGPKSAPNCQLQVALAEPIGPEPGLVCPEFRSCILGTAMGVELVEWKCSDMLSPCGGFSAIQGSNYCTTF